MAADLDNSRATSERCHQVGHDLQRNTHHTRSMKFSQARPTYIKYRKRAQDNVDAIATVCLAHWVGVSVRGRRRCRVVRRAGAFSTGTSVSCATTLAALVTLRLRAPADEMYGVVVLKPIGRQRLAGTKNLPSKNEPLLLRWNTSLCW